LQAQRHSTKAIWRPIPSRLRRVLAEIRSGGFPDS